MIKKTSFSMKIITSLMLSILTTTNALATMKNTPSIEQLPSKNEIIVAYYGRPGVKSLGILGQYSLENLMPVIKAKVKQYKHASGNNNIIPAFDIIYGLAAAEPGRKHDYILPLSHKKLMPYINAAQNDGFALFIDVQLGKMTPLQAIKPLLKYLKYKNVHLAIDPEFEVHGLAMRPGKVIGHITGTDVNRVQSAMASYLKENGIKEKKMLVVHMFRHSMVTDKKMVKNYANIDLIMNLDGHGSPRLKVDIYNSLYSNVAAAKVAGGFKLFFGEDKPKLMTPKQVLGLESVNGVRVKHMPKFINYQ